MCKAGRGALLLEAVFAIFILLVGVVVVAGLLHRSARYNTAQARLAEQIAFGESVMADIRQWALEPANYYGGWDYWNGRVVTSSQNPNLQATVACEPAGRELMSPSSTLEANWGARARTLSAAVVPVEVQVDHPGQNSHRLLSYVDGPRRQLEVNPDLSVSVASGSVPLARGAEATFEAQLLDQAGNPIDNVTFQWYLLPQTGNATLLLSSAPRNGEQVRLRNELQLLSGVLGYAPGQVRLQARARYFGQEVQNGDPPEPALELQ